MEWATVRTKTLASIANLGWRGPRTAYVAAPHLRVRTYWSKWSEELHDSGEGGRGGVLR